MSSSLDKLVENITRCGKCKSCQPGKCIKRYIDDQGCIQGGSKHGRRTFGISFEDCYVRRSRVSSAISVYDNLLNFQIGFSTVGVAQWVRRWNSGHRMMQIEGSSPGGDIYEIFSAMIFISVL